jgi:hypothetical protein
MLKEKQERVSTSDIQTTLNRIHEILQHHPGDSADWLVAVIRRYEEDEPGFYQALNSKRMWGGAGSIANQALADNPGMDETVWQHEIRQFRELMIELGTQLQARGNEYPDMSSWLLAFSNWNQTGI